ncbi:E3 ubiquitin-protein ligase MPSR1-like [Corylus avellana]|uniref:E3 ubiquitin-protein ligase MPSR1-like n=1 Tax=Corylus avellana TaxID=13451 RepID=UPI001E23B9BD|nr:E3 ubiquitin-protein ligase MPSR1-like [Corylus avellana]XP_059436664.1 E3 ubiquitin-protein ligase MPSR1-like [Corylus avellana]
MGALAEHRQAVLRDISLAAAAGTGRAPIVVALEHMTVVSEEVDDDDDDDDESKEVMDILLRESMAVDVGRPIPATRSAIERLEKVTFEDGLGWIGECIICTEEFEGGLELTRLPCSHVYHGGCIVKWLKMSRLCPLCRYPLPPVH